MYAFRMLSGFPEIFVRSGFPGEFAFVWFCLQNFPLYGYRIRKSSHPKPAAGKKRPHRREKRPHHLEKRPRRREKAPAAGKKDPTTWKKDRAAGKKPLPPGKKTPPPGKKTAPPDRKKTFSGRSDPLPKLHGPPIVLLTNFADTRIIISVTGKRTALVLLTAVLFQIR